MQESVEEVKKAIESEGVSKGHKRESGRTINNKVEEQEEKKC